MKISKELMKGSNATLILSVLSNEDMYGYKIVKELEKRSENVFSMKEGTLYPLLHMLEEAGAVEAYWQESSARKRRYYHITRKGRAMLKEKKEEFELYSTSVSRVLNYA
ncbi:MAG: helix-turn-helix transcriptional regulator [Eubacterium sp.]|nr:helix-turn-helix transcriptional regulator [Eubacterium sp.]MBR7060889.1 helix-turn-helix transcriptional regulator [Eubacterium sp.]